MVHTIILPKPEPLSSQDSQSFEHDREQLHRQMLSSVSHDLKTPLASIIGALEVLARMKDKLSEEKKSALVSVAIQEAYRLDNFITNIIDMAKLDNNMVKPKSESAEIGALIRHCLTKLEDRLRSSTVTLETAAPVNVMLDPVLLSRAICLVLDNAIKHGGTPPVIRISFGQDKGTGFITVHDNGGGIDEARLETIFSKYTRFVKEDQQNAGTGLGLSISKAIMNLLNGDIVVANHSDGGAYFKLHFPLK